MASDEEELLADAERIHQLDDLWDALRTAYARVAYLHDLMMRGSLGRIDSESELRALKRLISRASEAYLTLRATDANDHEHHQPLDLRRVLVVDDDKGYCRAVRRDLRKHEIHVFFETDPRLAVATFEQLRPAVVFVDIVMPLREGFHIAGEIKAIAPEAFVVLVTGHISDEYVARGARVADHLVDKDLGLRALRAIALGQRPGEVVQRVSRSAVLTDEQARRRNARKALRQSGTIAEAADRLDVDRRTLKRLAAGEDEG